ncbi:cytochrome c oxidase subunit II [Sphingomonas xanthus]|uniref:C-type cytochrome n=1 Tax=Sphingomonas xanthus TaxID=2594473 RepID=A0A516IU20_9SPHN|nr:c-type cytochrome [Sphingomonas xanthus]QDP20381.1 c-type cytochrome [Sphingomonas xanthus]
MMEALLGWPPAVLDPMGPYSSPVRTVAWALFGMGALITALVVAALALAWKGPPRWRARLGGEKAIMLLGVALPTVVLTGLLVWGLTLTARLDRPAADGAMRVRVIGEMWWFRVQYLDGDGRLLAEDANELRIPVGRPVALELESADVIHSFWVPQLSGKKDMVPGRTNRLTIQADRPGQFGGVCAEYCGRSHALMGMVVIAQHQPSFERWLAARIAPARRSAPGGEGFTQFVAAGCAACHAIDGTSAKGRAGPNLTNVATRRTLGAGIMPNNRGTLTGWVGDSQSIKPGNRMPSYDRLEPAQLKAITAYLETLK